MSAGGALLLSLLLATAPSSDVAQQLREAQSLAWSKHFVEAAAKYRAVLARDPQNRAARKGLATMEYWSGDYRAALRDFRALSNDADARRAVAEIEATMRPVTTAGVEFVSDDQPLRRTRAAASYTFFSDPLTTWTARAGGYAMNGRGYGTATMPFAELGGASTVGGTRVEGAARLLRFADGTSRALGSASLARNGFRVAIDRSELPYTATSIASHPFATTSTLDWRRGTTTLAAIHYTDYFDRNHGFAADAYHLIPVGTFLLGASAAYRDTAQSRFDGIRYDPYWTPLELTEVRAIAATSFHPSRATLDLHADAGVARDRGIDYHPWRVSAGVTWPLHGASVNAAIERQSTVFYRSTAVRIAITR